MVRYDALRVVLAVAAYFDLKILQVDVKTAFLYGVLEEDVFMKIPEGLQISRDQENLVVSLKNHYMA